MELEKIKRFSGIPIEPFREAFKLVNTFAGRLPGRFIWFAVVIFRLSSCIPENAKTIKSNRWNLDLLISRFSSFYKFVEAQFEQFNLKILVKTMFRTQNWNCFTFPPEQKKRGQKDTRGMD